SSRLARIQVDEIQALFKKNGVDVAFEPIFVETQGDKDKSTPLTANVADDFFTNTLDQALRDKTIDVAIHSAKDLPQPLRPGLIIFALTKNMDDTDAFIGKVRLAQLPKGAKVGTSSLVRQQSVKTINPHVQTVSIRGTIEERLKLLDEGKCDGIIIATVALKRLGLEQRITEIMPWDATPLQGQLAVIGREEDIHVRNLFAPFDVRRAYGKVLLVGAGPGDPDLITIKGVNALKKANCVFYDYLTDPKLLEYAAQAEKVYVGKRKGAHTLPQGELSKMIKNKALAGQTVVRLKGGDPLIFGRGADEINYLRAYHIDVEVIPGVTSATGIPSVLGIPLTARDISSSVAFVSGHDKEEETNEKKPIAIPAVDTIVFLMGLTKLDVIVDSLIKAKWPKTTPIVVISRGTRPDEKIVGGTLATIETDVQKGGLLPPALIVVGEVVRFYTTLPTLCALSALGGQQRGDKGSILYTGTHPEKYQALGRIIHLPMIAIAPAKLSEEEKKRLISSAQKADILLFTSRFAVQYFCETMKASALGHKEIFAIGQETRQALERYGLKPTLVAETESGEGLVEAILNQKKIKGKKIIFPRSSLPNPYIRRKLIKAGADVDEYVVYCNIKPPKRELNVQSVDEVLFTSPSTVKNFLEDYGQIPKDWKILSKGPLTNKYLQEHGYKSELFVYE
ncbi:MAG: uroporphyrinogen-III C-methyltransferase, partial [Candidatus Omnitrophota bacterium]|nr:uroporphyrinogen-III C-methyltransferase [Candidatus Omnitrophota bacterium]